MKRIALFASLATALVLSACSAPGTSPQLPSASWDAVPMSCYVGKIAPQHVQATITFYGWPDNDPPGAAIAHPVIHKVAGGDGTYCNPTTFATEHKNDSTIPYGTKIYVSFLKQYFVREDLCAASGPPVGHGNNGCYKLWFDLWIGGDANSNTHDVVRCENHLTPGGKSDVILNPGNGLPVKNPGPIYRDGPAPDGTCF